MIGIDSADVDYIDSSLGQLPHLRRLFADGRVMRLHSPGEVMSASVWPTFYTGALPGTHGYYYPMQWDPDTMRLRRVTGEWLSSEPFWYGLARRGCPVTTLDVQTAFPGPLASGVEIINWGAQSFDTLHCNRPELAREILRRFGKHPMGPDIPVEKGQPRLERMRRDLIAGVRARGELSRWLLAQTDWRLFIAVFTECHRGGHYLWPDPAGDGKVPPDALLDVHRAVDQEVGSLLASVDLDHTTVIVFSLHGMGRNSAQTHFVAPVLERINAGFAREAMGGRGARRPRRAVMAALRERLPAPLQETVARAVPEAVRDWVTTRVFTGGVDWTCAPGFLLPSGSEGFIRCNLAGRERRGMYPAGSALHRLYRERVRSEFLALKVAGTDAPLVRDVVFPTDLFPGPRSDYLPDIAVLWHPIPPAREIYSERLGRFTARLATGRPGNHRADGFAAVIGKGAEAAHAQPMRHIVDFSRLVPALLPAA